MQYTRCIASDENCPRDLIGTQRIPAASCMVGCEKSVSMGNKPNKCNANNKYKIATWNVRGLNEIGKIENVMNEMKNMNIDILGVSETFLQGTGDFTTNLPTGERFRTMYSGGDISRKGTAFICNERTATHVTNILPISERIIAINVQASPANIFIIQCYAPNLATDDEEKEAFYDDLRETIKKKKYQEVLILTGDFNAKVGNQKVDDVIGPYGLGIRNSAGELFINFCHENNLFVCNTWFQQKEASRHTWISPDGGTKNQIDFVCVNKRYRNAITNAKSRPGADCGSDHNPVVINMNIKLKKITKKKIVKKWDLEKLNNEESRNTFVETFNKETLEVYSNTYTKENIEENWKIFKHILESTAKEVIGFSKRGEKKKKWITQEIINLMEERKKHKRPQSEEDQIKYKELKRKIQKLCRKEKENFINLECQEAENLERIDSARFHKKVNELTWGTKSKRIECTLNDENGNEIFEPELILKRWAQYCEKLYKDERPDRRTTSPEEDEIPEFNTHQIKLVLKRLNKKKAPGSDNIPAELLKLMEGAGLVFFTDLINMIYKKGIIPTDFMESVFIPIPKVCKAKNCADFRTISLISHASKILLYLIKDRIYNLIEENLSETQMGFRGGKGCRDAISAMRVLLEKKVEKGQDIFLTFIDYEKAFDNVSHEKLVSILRNINLPQADIRLIEELYWGQKGKVRTSLGLSEDFTISKGTRQGCIISPLLFNIYVEQIIKESIADNEHGITINNRVINNLRYADDLVLLSSDRNGLKTLLKKLHDASTKYNMKINVKKSKYMRMSKKEHRRLTNIDVNGQVFEEVAKYKYLGSEITNDGRCQVEINKRIGIAKNAFWKHRDLMTRNISKTTKLRLLKTYVFSILTYGCEAWTIHPEFGKKITSFELWCYRRMLKVSWVDKITNVEILRRMGKSTPELLKDIRERKLKFAGHIMRGSSGQLLLDIIEGDVEGPRPRGRPRRMWLDDVKEWLGVGSYEECKELAMNRELFRTTVTRRLATIDHDDAT